MQSYAMHDLGSTASTKLFRIFWVTASMLWIPLCFINFDPHHDGIILTTVNQLKSSLVTGGSWPFNQYGSAWAIPYLLISFLVPDHLLLLSIRFLTVSFYTLATYFLYRSALVVFGHRTARISVLLYLTLQPFLGPWNTSLLPWPSSLVTFLIALILYLLLTIPGRDGAIVRKNLVITGFLSAIILGSRIQVGILLLISTTAILYFLKLGKIRYLAGGVSLWLFPFSILLQLKGWLLPSLYDSIILGAQFLGSDHLHYPLPVLSLLAGVCVFIWLELSLARKINNYVHTLLLFIAVLATILLSKRVLGDSFNLPNYFSVTQRKILAALFFAAILLTIIEIFKVIRMNNKIREDYVITRRVILYTVSVCSAAQAWPFFDQMHIWWSFAPIVIIFAEKLSLLNLDRNMKLDVVYLSFIVVLMSFLVLSQFSGSKMELKSINQNLIFVNSLDEKNEAQIQKFIFSNIPSGSRILNLCPNAYPFFIPGDYKSVSRFFVYWSNFESAPIDYKDYNPSEVKYVISCNTYLYQDDELRKYELRKRQILESMPRLNKINEFGEGAFKWEIFSDSDRLLASTDSRSY